MLPAAARSHRHSIDTLAQLLRSPNVSGVSGRCSGRLPRAVGGRASSVLSCCACLWASKVAVHVYTCSCLHFICGRGCSTAWGSQHGVDTPFPQPSLVQLGSPTASSAARLMQQLVEGRAATGGTAPGSAPSSNAVRARLPVRHSMDGVSRQLEAMARSLTVISGAHRCGAVGTAGAVGTVGASVGSWGLLPVRLLSMHWHRGVLQGLPV